MEAHSVHLALGCSLDAVLFSLSWAHSCSTGAKGLAWMHEQALTWTFLGLSCRFGGDVGMCTLVDCTRVTLHACLSHLQQLHNDSHAQSLL